MRSVLPWGRPFNRLPMGRNDSITRARWASEIRQNRTHRRSDHAETVVLPELASTANLRAPPATCLASIVVGMQPDMLAAVDSWIASQSPGRRRSGAWSRPL